MIFFKLHNILECDSTCVFSCKKNKYNCDECIEGYVKIENKCIQCNSPCKNCSLDKDYCSSCIEGYYYSANKCPSKNKF